MWVDIQGPYIQMLAVNKESSMDIGTISSAYSAVKTIKELGSSLLEAKIDAESKQRVTEVLETLGGVQDTLFFIREELLKAQDKNHGLKEKVKELEKKLEEKGKIQYEKPSYWVIENECKDGPFCQKCYDANQMLIRLQGGNNDIWSCHECKSTYYGPGYISPSRRVNRSRNLRTS